MASSTYDIVIVGGGTAGLILAARLSEDPDLQVAVLESGEDHSSDMKVQTPGMWPFLRNSPMDWAFRSSPQSGRKGTSLPMPQGRMLGGTSGINGFAFAPSTQANLDFWSALGNTGWGFENIDQATRKAVTVHTPAGTTDGSGPIHLVANESEIETKWLKTWLDSLGKLGYLSCDSFSGTQRGVITNLDTIDPVSKARCYSANAYLGQVRSRTNLTVLTRCTVNRIIFGRAGSNAKPVAEGVVASSKDGGTKVVYARKEVVLSAGAINSPRILEVSGIGDKRRLNQLGIDVMVDNPYVGENFQNHLYAGFSMEVQDDVETLDPFFRQEPDAVAAAKETYEQGKGGPIGRSTNLCFAPMPLREVTDEDGLKEIEKLLNDTASEALGSSLATPSFKRAWESYIRGDITTTTEAAVRFMFVPGYAPWESDNPLYRAPGNHFTIAMMLSHPISRGSVHISSGSHEHSDKNTGLTLDVGLVANPVDVEILARYLMFAEKILARLEPFASLLKPREDRFTDMEKAREYIRAVLNAAHHYIGTCAMMSQEMGGVVDDKLRVYGCSKLRVCDASIIPIVPQNNSQAVVYAVAEHGAEIIKGTLV